MHNKSQETRGPFQGMKVNLRANKQKETMNKHLITLVVAATVAATPAINADTQQSKVQSWTSAHLTERYNRLTQRFKENSFGIYVGPMRWISHAIDEKKSRDEFFAVSKELNRRGIHVSTQIPKEEED